MLLACATAFVSINLAFTVFMWPHPPGLIAATLIASVVAFGASVMSIIDPRQRHWLATSSALLVVTAFAYSEAGVLTVAISLAAASLFQVMALGPGLETLATVSAAAPLPVTPGHEERRAA